MSKIVKVLCAAIAIGLSAASPANAGPFDALAGQWSGGGTVSYTDGSNERLQCKARYDVRSDSLKLSLVCATDNYKIDARSNVRYNSGFLSGDWQEITRNLGGDVSGSAIGNTISAQLQSGGSTLLNFKIVTNGGAQSVRIAPQPGTPLKSVQVNMTRKP